MSAQELIVFIITGGLFSPFITALVNRPAWSRLTKQAVATIVALVLAAFVGWLTGTLTGSPLEIVVTVLGMAALAYSYIWKPSGLVDLVEIASSPKTIESAN